MSTRANIVIKDKSGQLIFYRHSDGYPEGTLPTLNIFMDWLNKGHIRNNVSQAAGWLIIIGANEYDYNRNIEDGEYRKGLNTPLSSYSPDKPHPLSNVWKVGAYEPTTCIHSDIEFYYEIDLCAKSLRCWNYNREFKTEIDLSL